MPTEVRYRKRDTREIVAESIFAESTLRWFYEAPMGRLAFALLLNNRLANRLYGKWQDRPSTRRLIPGFAAAYGVDLDEAELPVGQYSSFNAFFSRRLKVGARPFEADPSTLCSPCDGKVLLYPELEPAAELPVKGDVFTLAELLGSAEVARPFLGGAAAVMRLAPYDYHRFHFPDAGTAGRTLELRGRYDSVSPISLARVPRVLGRNRRNVTVIETEHFGRVAMVEVGALSVGSIVQTYAPGPVERGQEKGYFQFGGSTVVLVFEVGAIAWDADLLEDSERGVEVEVRAGSRIGKARSTP